MLATLVSLLIGLPPSGAGLAVEPPMLHRQVAAASVRISERGGETVATGVAVAARGGYFYVLTAAHAVKGAGAFSVQSAPAANGNSSRHGHVDVLLREPACDVALLRVRVGEQAPPSLPIAGFPVPGDIEEFDAVSVAFAGTTPLPRVERVLAKKLLKRGSLEATFVWETRARPEPGRSGGPLVDSAGRVIGVCRGAQDGRGYFCHQEEIAALLKKRGYAWLVPESDAK